MKARDFERLGQLLKGRTASDIDQRMTRLRDRGLIPSGGRGTGAPNLEPHHAALTLLQLIAPKATEAFEPGVRACSLRLAYPPGVADVLGRPAGSDIGLLVALTILLVEYGQHAWRRLLVDSDGDMACLTIVQEGRPLDVFFVTDLAKFNEIIDGNPDRYANQGGGAKPVFAIGPSLIGHIAALLKFGRIGGVAEPGTVEERAANVAVAANAERKLESVLALSGRLGDALK